MTEASGTGGCGAASPVLRRRAGTLPARPRQLPKDPRRPASRCAPQHRRSCHDCRAAALMFLPLQLGNVQRDKEADPSSSKSRHGSTQSRPPLASLTLETGSVLGGSRGTCRCLLTARSASQTLKHSVTSSPSPAFPQTSLKAAAPTCSEPREQRPPSTAPGTPTQEADGNPGGQDESRERGRGSGIKLVQLSA